ncbi:MAG TPA: surface-adhesin E family protein [Caulobacteraceae bacterium]|nr:surface-adhesin E family protein [Caulobacteraceae bacterium]
MGALRNVGREIRVAVIRFDTSKRYLAGSAIVALLLAASLSAKAQTVGSPPARAAKSDGQAPNWMQIQETNQSNIYIDQNSVQPGDAEPDHTIIVDAVGLEDFKIAQVLGGHQVSSVEYLTSFDCHQKELMLLGINYYDLSMGTGRVVNGGKSADAWHTPQPNTLEDLLWNAVCAGK